MIIIIVGITTGFLGLLGVIWSSKTGVDRFMRAILIALTVANAYVFGVLGGWI
jgi:hypothetical protein